MKVNNFAGWNHDESTVNEEPSFDPKRTSSINVNLGGTGLSTSAQMRQKTLIGGDLCFFCKPHPT